MYREEKTQPHVGKFGWIQQDSRKSKKEIQQSIKLPRLVHNTEQGG